MSNTLISKIKEHTHSYNQLGENVESEINIEKNNLETDEEVVIIKRSFCNDGLSICERIIELMYEIYQEQVKF